MSVCIKQLGDFQLAVAIARVVEQSNEGPIMQDILENTILPIAFQLGNRWLASWAFWLLHRRDLAVRIILVRDSFFFTISKEVQSIYRHLYKILPPASTCGFRRSESLITTTQAWHCCFHSYDRKHCKLRKEPAKFQVDPNSTLSYRCLVSSVGWVSVALHVPNSNN